ncbi:MAG: PD-(D/E)XK nuclease family transposase [Planctomycetota bacterium]
MAPGISLLVDFAFKMLFGNEQHPRLTIRFLNAMLGGEPRIVSVQILNSVRNRTTANGKQSILDILATDNLGRILNIEVQTWLPLTTETLYTASEKELWLFFVREAHRLTAKEIIRHFPGEEFAEAAGVLEMISKSRQKKIEYEARLKFQRDQYALREGSLMIGHQQGLREGRQQGLQAGSAGRARRTVAGNSWPACIDSGRTYGFGLRSAQAARSGPAATAEGARHLTQTWPECTTDFQSVAFTPAPCHLPPVPFVQ